MNLSRYFTLDELTHSNTAKAEGIANQPGAGEIMFLRALCTTLLDPLREAVGRPIKVNSGYRGPALNQRIRGAKNSQHLTGQAADIQSPGTTVLELFKKVIRLKLPFDQIIYEVNGSAKWVHLSHNPGANRGEILLAQFGADGRVTYPRITAQQALGMTEPSTRGVRSAAEPDYIETADEPEQEATGERASRKAAPRKPAPRKPAPRKTTATTKTGAKRAPAKRADVKRQGHVQVRRNEEGRRTSAQDSQVGQRRYPKSVFSGSFRIEVDAMLSEGQLRQIMPNLPTAKAAGLLPHLNRAMAEYRINTMPRAAAFVAQLAHESGELRWMEEIWGPTPTQRLYEPTSRISKVLGNTQPGDGSRFKGRGPIQITGRDNYQRFGKLLGLDLISAPERAAEPGVAFRVAALYWANRGLNELADQQDFREITRRINAGLKGFADRQKYFERAKAVLATGFGAVTRSAQAGARLALPPRREVPTEPLMRGLEAIRGLKTPRRPARKTSAKAAARRGAPARKAAAKKGASGKVRPKTKSSQKSSAAAKRATKAGGKTSAPARKAATSATVKRRAAVKPAKRGAAASRARRR
jgi:predicted chitinase